MSNDCKQLPEMNELRALTLDALVESATFRIPRQPVSREFQNGWVLVEFDVDESGQVSNSRIINSCPIQLYNRAALKALDKFRFKESLFNKTGQYLFVAEDGLVK
ncbi:energy transducer TonB [Microbulbifer sp. JTAC008]|uniref:energy transducer TonB n=1 Tax=unclassified Microbulbifer TaxID=2619833 RepID=UPI0040392320